MQTAHYLSLASVYTQLITSVAHAVRLRFSIAAPRGLTMILNLKCNVVNLSFIFAWNDDFWSDVLCYFYIMWQYCLSEII